MRRAFFYLRVAESVRAEWRRPRQNAVHDLQARFKSVDRGPGPWSLSIDSVTMRTALMRHPMPTRILIDLHPSIRR
jgi:hypothetical protein